MEETVINNINQLYHNYSQLQNDTDYRLEFDNSDEYGHELGNIFPYAYPQQSQQPIPQSRPKTLPYSDVVLPDEYNLQAQDSRDIFNIMTSFPQYFQPNDSGFSSVNRTQNIIGTNRAVDESTSMTTLQYPDLTSLINSNSNIMAPLVENTFVDYKTCKICGKKISRDMVRHMRTHQPEGRFKCNFPQRYCSHRSRQFNRPYDHKKHLLNRHFMFDIPEVKKMINLNDKLKHTGTCLCGARYVAKEWLENHVLTSIAGQKCHMIE